MFHVFVLVTLLLLSGQQVVFSAEEQQCEDSTIVVQGAVQEDIKDGCVVANSAARFFEYTGLSIPRNIKITIVEAQPSTFPEEREMGSYDARLNVIRVLPFQSAVKATDMNEPGLGKITTRTHWRSYIAHELAHAAIHAGCDKACPSRAIHEYVAAVAQISSVPSDQRSELLAPYRDLDPFGHLSEISETYYAINPHYFAVKAYKHFQRLSDPRSFFRSMLRSENWQ